MRRFVYSILLCLVIPALAQEAPAPQESSSAQNAAETANTRKVDHLPTDDAGKAEAAILKGDWKAAEPLLSSWLAGHPDDASALFDAGYVADAQGRNEDAIGFYRKATEADPASFEAEVSLGLLLARLGRTEEARPILEKSTNLDAGSSQPQAKAKAWRAMAQIDLSGSGGEPDLAQASIDLLEALKLTPETAADTLLAARIAEAGGDSTAAEAAYRRALKSDAGSSIASAGLAHLLIAQKKYADAESLLQTARKKSPDDAALTAQLAAVMVAEDKTDALPLLQEFHSKHPQDQAITRMLAEVLADAGEYTESEALYTTLLAATPKDSHLLSGHGQNLIRLHRYPEALKAFESATEIDETNGEAWNGLAFAAFQTHEPTITLHALTVRSKYLPESATVYFLWATAYDTLHDTKQAVAYYHRFLDSAQGKFPDQEWQARQRMKVLDKAP